MTRPLSPLTLSEQDRRILAVWAADCAERVLPLFEAEAPNDSRPREAIESARAFASGELRIGPARILSARAHAAARAMQNPAAVAAARAAGHAAGVAHMAAHARGVAYAAVAAGLAAPEASKSMVDEARWQFEHATKAVREILRKLPPPPRVSSRLGQAISDMYEKLRPNQTDHDLLVQ